MRVIAESARPEFKITIFYWNAKYLIKFEQPLLEQTYKIAELDVSGEVALKKLLDDHAFLRGVQARFDEMRAALGEARQKL